MTDTATAVSAADLMTEFAERTGISGNGAPRRYLWTDAFAVCNFLDLYARTGDTLWRDVARRLVGQVHHVLGRHRPDDMRTGWISGLSDSEGERRPTAGGLRIGKDLPERSPGEAHHEQLEWDRDGQYYHYLTKWMHALSRMARETGDVDCARWAVELARVAHERFTFIPRQGGRRMYWKMSIDLTLPLVPSMGQHDPLDGLVTCCEIRFCGETAGVDTATSLDRPIDEITEMVASSSLMTDDPLGLGGLLFDARRIVQLAVQGAWNREGVLEWVLEAAGEGLAFLDGKTLFGYPPAYRLAFRELGLAIGLHGLERMQGWVRAHPDRFAPAVPGLLERLAGHLQLREDIEAFWLDPAHREERSWQEHRDINDVMLATCLGPEGFLKV